MIKHPPPTSETVNHVESVIESNSHQAHEKQTQNKNESKMKASYSYAFHSVEPLFQRIYIFFPPSPITLPFSRALPDCVRNSFVDTNSLREVDTEMDIIVLRCELASCFSIMRPISMITDGAVYYFWI